MNTLKILGLIVLATQFAFAESYFPKDYESSREALKLKFQSLKRAYGVDFETFSYKVPSQVDDDLTIDGAFLNCERSVPKKGATKLLVLTSGVHGPESFVGAAAQHWYLNTEVASKCRQGLSMLLIHAINPYGFKYLRRFDESNIDLNRNFPTKPELYETINESYDGLQKVLNPKRPTGPLIFKSAAITTRILSKLLGGASVSDIRQASVGGQYEHPKGIYFGGKEPSPQSVWLEDILKKYLNTHDHVLHYDFHTGLGEKGVLHMITGPSMTKFGEKVLGNVFKKYENTRFDITAPTDPGFYEVGGDFVDFVPKFKENKKILGLTVEYGTVGLGIFAQLKTLTRIINENQGHHYGYRSKRIEKRVKKRFKDLFFPTKESWRKQIQETNSFIMTDVLDDFIKVK